MTYMRDKMLKLWTDEMAVWDDDGDGKMERAEFFRFLRRPQARMTLSEIGVDVLGLVEVADYLFRGDNMKMGFPEFFEKVLELRGNNDVKVADIMHLRKMI